MAFGQLAPISALTLGGGGLGMLWGPTTFDECVATVHAAVEGGTTLLDLAPRLGVSSGPSSGSSRSWLPAPPRRRCTRCRDNRWSSGRA